MTAMDTSVAESGISPRVLTPTGRLSHLKPYPGLRSFTQQEASLFFGREVQVRQLRDILADRNLAVVLGGSGSGKSSLVRAGLLPKLNSTAPIPKRSGAWYPIEFRPRTHPADELFEAIFAQIFQPLVKASLLFSARKIPSAGEVQSLPEIDAERLRHFEAVSAALEISPPLQFDEDVEARCKKKLRELLFSGPTIDIGSLFEFAEQAIVTLDAKLATGPRSGKANLLILIDQFEEVFSLPAQTKEDGLNMVMSLVTSIQAFRPDNLFLIVTMRNEWLHHCSEIPGVADAMNGSTYLVDLLAASEIRNIIVEPARSVLRAVNLDPGPPGRGPYTEETLRLLQRAFDDVAAVQDASDRLPLLQHLLPLLWVTAAAEQDSRREKVPFSIEAKHLVAVPGWNSERSLPRCLNAHAGQVLNDAVNAARESAPMLGKEDADQLMRVAFTNLAVLDEKGIVRRQFATVDQMLDSSGLVERHQGNREEIKKAFTKALAKFRTDALIDFKTTAEGELFDINHEALVRNWETCAAWVGQARLLKNGLRAIDEKIRSAQADKVGTSSLTRLIDLLFAADLKSAAEQVGSETAKELLDNVFGPHATFSRSWVGTVLGNNDVARVSRRVSDAQRFRNNPWHQYRVLAVLLIIVVFAVGAIAFINARLTHEKDQLLAKVDSTFDLQSIARKLTNLDETDPKSKAEAVRDKVEDFIAFRMASDKSNHYQELPVELQKPLADTLVEFDGKWRLLLAGKVWLRTSMTENPSASKLEDSICIDPGTKKTLPILNDEAVAWVPILEDERERWQPAIQRTGKNMAVPSSLKVGEDWQPQSVVCTSPDGRWQFTWMVTKDGNGKSKTETPRIRNIVVKRLRGSSGDARLYVNVGSERFFDDADSKGSYESELFPMFSEVSAAAQNEKRSTSSSIRFARDGHWVGFLISVGNGKTFALWTTEGVGEPQEEVERRDVVECVKQKTVTSRCIIGPLKYSGEQYEISITSTRPSKDFPECHEAGAVCIISVQLQYAEKARRKNVRLQLEKITGTQIKGGTITSDGYLILADDGGQFWRYLIEGKKLAKLQKDTWRGADLKGIEWSAPCVKLGCKKEVDRVD